MRPVTTAPAARIRNKVSNKKQKLEKFNQNYVDFDIYVIILHKVRVFLCWPRFFTIQLVQSCGQNDCTTCGTGYTTLNIDVNFIPDGSSFRLEAFNSATSFALTKEQCKCELGR